MLTMRNRQDRDWGPAGLGAGPPGRDAGGAEVGQARLEPDGNAVHVQVRACGFPPGFHGFRVLGVGLC